MHRVKPHKKQQRHFLIMSSVFYTDKYIHAVFDLKGSTQGRAATAKEIRSGNPVYKDNDFTSQHIQLRLSAFKAQQVQEQLARDVEFLRQLSIMDYSLLLGIHYRDRPTPGEGRVSGVHEMEMTRSGVGSAWDRENGGGGKSKGEKGAAAAQLVAPATAVGSGVSSSSAPVASAATVQSNAAVREGGGRADGEGGEQGDGDDGWRRHHFGELQLPPHHHHPSSSSNSSVTSHPSSSSSSVSSSLPPFSSVHLSGPVRDSGAHPATTEAQAEAIVGQSSPASAVPPFSALPPTIQSPVALPVMAIPSPTSSAAVGAAASSSPLSSEGEAPRWHIQADDSPGHAEQSSDEADDSEEGEQQRRQQQPISPMEQSLPLHLDQLHLHIEEDEREDGQPHPPLISVVPSPPSAQQRALQPSFSSTSPLPYRSIDPHQRPSASTSTSPLPPAFIVVDDHPPSAASLDSAAMPRSEADGASAVGSSLPNPVRPSSHSVPHLLAVPLTPAAAGASYLSSSHSPSAGGSSPAGASAPSSPTPDYAKRQSTYGLPKVHPHTSRTPTSPSTHPRPPRIRTPPLAYLQLSLSFLSTLLLCGVRVRVCVLCVVCQRWNKTTKPSDISFEPPEFSPLPVTPALDSPRKRDRNERLSVGGPAAGGAAGGGGAGVEGADGVGGAGLAVGVGLGPGVLREEELPFLSAHGGIGSASVGGVEGREIYFMGIIDILTIYSLQKYVENRYKRARLQKGISAVSPRKYADRFKAFIAAGILVVHSGDRSTRTGTAGGETLADAVSTTAAPTVSGAAAAVGSGVTNAHAQQPNGRPVK